MPRRSATLLLLAACGSGHGGLPTDASPSGDAESNDAALIDARVPQGRDLDLLFVVDNSFGTAEEQAELIAAFPAFIAKLEARFTVLPNLHIGVVSSDVGAGGYDLGTCVGDGDDGSLTTRASSCPALIGAFIEDMDMGGTRVRNYDGSLSDVFGCLAALGTGGCGFEQHLESMQRALDGSRPENAGFLRADAALLVVVLADEDDCSAADGLIFTPDGAFIPTFGPASSFRCTQFGVVCDGAAVPRAAASYSSCGSAETGYIRNPTEYADFLTALKADPTKVGAAVLVGPDLPFVVESTGPDSARLAPSCTTALGSAVPGVRLRDFQAAFGSRGLGRTLCADDLEGDLVGVADFIADELL